jgi:hypothetical protein
MLKLCADGYVIRLAGHQCHRRDRPLLRMLKSPTLTATLPALPEPTVHEAMPDNVEASRPTVMSIVTER